MATYYVSTTGNNGAAGSLAAPWRNLTYAYTRVSAGDTVYVRGGTYTSESNSVDFDNKNGSAGAKYRFEAYQAEIPIFDGGGGGGTWSSTNTSFTEWVGLRWANRGNGYYVGYSSACHDLLFQNCHFYNTDGEAFRVTNNSYNIVVDGCTIHDSGLTRNGEGVYLGTRSDGDNGYNVHHVTVKNCTIYNTNDDGIELKPATHDCIIENNTLYNNNTGGSDTAAIEVDEVYQSPNTYASDPLHIIRGNVIGPETTADGIVLATGCYCYNNIISGIGGSRNGITIDMNRFAGGTDTYIRRVYHNTVNGTVARAIIRNAGNWESKNNIGPATDLTTNKNLAYNAAYFVNAAGSNYHLVASSAPINTGLDLRSSVPTDKDGATRDSTPDLGAYEYGGAAAPVGTPTLSVR